MGCLEFLVYYYLINTARNVKFSDLNFASLIPYPTIVHNRLVCKNKNYFFFSFKTPKNHWRHKNRIFFNTRNYLKDKKNVYDRPLQVFCPFTRNLQTSRKKVFGHKCTSGKGRLRTNGVIALIILPYVRCSFSLGAVTNVCLPQRL